MKNNNSRRKFIQQSGVLGAGIMLSGTSTLFSETNISNHMSSNIKSKGYAGKDEHGNLALWNFERRPVGDKDVLIGIKYSGICHSDIHTIRDIGVNNYIRKYQVTKLQA